MLRWRDEHVERFYEAAATCACSVTAWYHVPACARANYMRHLVTQLGVTRGGWRLLARIGERVRGVVSFTSSYNACPIALVVPATHPDRMGACTHTVVQSDYCFNRLTPSPPQLCIHERENQLLVPRGSRRVHASHALPPDLKTSQTPLSHTTHPSST